MRLLADENFDNDILRGLQNYVPELDAVRIQDVGLRTVDDPTILEWAAQEERIVLTHDVSTMKDFAYERVAAGKSMPGVFVVKRTAAIGKCIEDLRIVIEASIPGEWEGIVLHIPMT